MRMIRVVQQQMDLIFGVAAEDAQHIAAVACVHADEIVVVRVILAAELHGVFPLAGDTAGLKQGADGRIDGIADLVAGVPDSGLTAAMGYAKASGIPYEIIFHKNSYVGRTFIKPTQEERENSVRIKLNILEPAVRGKRIVLVDDSIVRGTTMKNLIRMLKKAGAKEVHVRVSPPPFLFPCYFGTDVPSNKQLIASSHSVEEICREIGADSLGYMPVEDLEEMAGGLPLCTACFTGNYPMDVPDGEIKDALE